MIIAGPCLYTEHTERERIIETAKALNDSADFFRCKLWGGGTSPEKFMSGVGNKGIELLDYIHAEIIPVMTEAQNNHQIMACRHHNIDGVWIGARNSQNYALIDDIEKYWPKEKIYMVKRGSGMTIEEVIGLFDIYNQFYNREIYIIERGINTFDRLSNSRWSPDLKGMIRIKNERPDIFRKMVVDCSHSVGEKAWIEDTYKAFKAIGVENFMFECTIDGESKTDNNQMLSTDKLKDILK